MNTKLDERQGSGLKRGLRAVYERAGNSVIVPLLAVSLALGWLSRAVFFRFALQIWARQFHVDLATVNSWERDTVLENDGAEPEVLLALVTVSTVLMFALAYLLPRFRARMRVLLTLGSGCGALLLFRGTHFTMPYTVISAHPAEWLVVLTLAVGASVLLGWGPPARRPVSVALVLLLVPIVFLPCAAPSPGDAQAILTPALRLMHGVAPAHVWMQYDLLPSLLGAAWLWLGGDPMAIFLGVSLSHFIALIALVLLVQRWFTHPGLRGPLLVAVVLVRIYAAGWDHIAIPQVAPFRLDVWLIPVACALYFGVRHWMVAVALGALCVFSRSIGVLYLGGYALAFLADFLSAYLASSTGHRAPLNEELRRFMRLAGRNSAILLGCLALATLLLGSPISDAALLYHKLGVGQTRIEATSFYWWLLPLTALSGGLAFWKRGELGEQRGGAMLLMVGLLISSSIYFFGRSHENNLISLATPFLVCFFLSLDICLKELAGGRRAARSLQILLSSALVALCAVQYSAGIWTRVGTQLAVLSRTEAAQPMYFPHLPPTYCDEVAASALDRKVYFFMQLDFWYYQRCDYEPPSHEEPVALSLLKQPLMDELGELLDHGYTIALLKGEPMAPEFDKEYAPALSVQRVLTSSESAHYRFIRAEKVKLR